MNALTPKQKEVLDGVRRGLSSKDIATGLGVVERTVIGHLAKLYKKTGTRNRIQLLNAVDSQTQQETQS